jgi:hypothetical protein
MVSAQEAGSDYCITAREDEEVPLLIANISEFARGSPSLPSDPPAPGAPLVVPLTA